MTPTEITQILAIASIVISLAMPALYYKFQKEFRQEFASTGKVDTLNTGIGSLRNSIDLNEDKAQRRAEELRNLISDLRHLLDKIKDENTKIKQDFELYKKDIEFRFRELERERHREERHG